MARTNPLSNFSLRRTGQNAPIPGTDQTRNNAGGFVWMLDDWSRLRRFLILGVDGPTYYASEKALVKENATVLLQCIAADGPRTVNEIITISTAGRNAKQHAVIFALAACAGADDAGTRALALAALPKVCRTGTQLFLFAGYVEQFRGWGRGLRKAVGSWYVDRDPDSLALQLVKYQQRESWSHRDLLRLAKPQPVRGGSTDSALAWAVGKVSPSLAADELSATMPKLIRAFRSVHAETTVGTGVDVVTSSGLPWEALPSELLRDPRIWSALLPTMGIGALVRNLGRMTGNGTLVAGNAAVDLVCARLSDGEAIRRSRLHPISVLSALITYRSGTGNRGSGTWEPVAAIVDALDATFYRAFGNVEPSGKRTLLALDVSGSMASGRVAGVLGLTPRIASAAMAAVTLATEPAVTTVAFTSKGRGYWKSTNGKVYRGWEYGVSPLAISARQRLDDIVSSVSDLPFGGTDCALPMLYAMEKGLSVDHFVVYTDSETWAGDIHPSQALRQYRERSGIDARLTVVGMVSNGFSIANPLDRGMLDVVGFDTAAPQMIADFAAGRL